MFGGNRNNWIAQELSNISQMLSRVATELSALNQDVKNMHSEQLKHEGRIEKIEERVRVLETVDVKDKSKWDGAKVLWAILAASLTAAGIVIALVALFI